MKKIRYISSSLVVMKILKEIINKFKKHKSERDERAKLIQEIKEVSSHINKLKTPEEIKELIKSIRERVDEIVKRRKMTLDEAEARLKMIDAMKRPSQSLEDAPEIDSNENGDEGSSNQ